MIIISKRDLLMLGLVSTGTVLLLGALGYSFFSNPDIELRLGSKLMAERFLFISLGVAVIFLVLYGATLVRSLNVSREIEKMIERTGSGDYRPEKSLRKLGNFGDQISRLHTRLSEINRKQAMKIASQSLLIGFIAGNMEQPFLICDVIGRIHYISKGYLEKRKVSRSELTGTFVENLSSDIVTQLIVAEVSSSHAAVDVTLEKEKEEITVHPVFNRDGEVSYLVFDFSQERFFSREAFVPERQKQKRTGEQGRLWASPFGGLGAL